MAKHTELPRYTRQDLLEKYKDFKPLPVDAPSSAFGAMGEKLKALAPMYLDYKVCEVQEDAVTPSLWEAVVTQWFFKGLKPGDQFDPREGIDGQAARSHIGAVLRSFEPDHMSKERICRFLLDLWFEGYTPDSTHDPRYIEKIARAMQVYPK
jgi:hypothetical protein